MVSGPSAPSGGTASALKRRPSCPAACTLIDCRPDGTPSHRTNTSYFVFTGPNTAVGDRAEPKIENITDGTSNTILAVEAQRDIPWTKPEDIPYAPDHPLPDLDLLFKDGFRAGMADGDVRWIPSNMSAETLRAAITRNGGEELGPDW